MHRLARDLLAIELRAHHLAPALNHALDHLATQLSWCDGYPAATGDPKVRSTPTTSTTERAAALRHTLTRHRENIHTTVRELHALMTHLDRLVAESYGLIGDPDPPVAATVPLCRDGLTGKDGALEWGDPMCMMPAIKGGLCRAHYWAWYRWRIKVGRDVSRDFEPAAN